MKLSQRYCQHCSHRALTAAVRGKRMRSGYVFRKNHDLCARCFRAARAAAERRWLREGGKIGPLRSPRPAARRGTAEEAA